MIKVLVVDDSKFIQNVITRILKEAPDIEVVAAVSNGIEALNKVHSLNPDVVTLDIVMSPMDGLSVLSRIMEKNPVPVIVVSSLSTNEAAISIDALKLGAVDYVAKPGGDSPLWMEAGLKRIKDELLAKIRIAAIVDKNKLRALYQGENHSKAVPAAITPDKIVTIGSSVGGPQALMSILPKFPRNFNALFLVSQHMSPFFIKAFTERLNKTTRLKVKVAREEKEEFQPGTVIFAPGDANIILKKSGKGLNIVLEKKHRFRGLSCIDVMMRSVAEAAGKNSIGVLLSGMGRDGVEGLECIKKAGGKTIAQNEETSIIFGMPMEAIKKGVVDKVLPLERIPRAVIRMVEENK